MSDLLIFAPIAVVAVVGVIVVALDRAAASIGEKNGKM